MNIYVTSLQAQGKPPRFVGAICLAVSNDHAPVILWKGTTLHETRKAAIEEGDARFISKLKKVFY